MHQTRSSPRLQVFLDTPGLIVAATNANSAHNPAHHCLMLLN